MYATTQPAALSHPAGRVVRAAALVVAIAALAGTVALYFAERAWDARNQPQPDPTSAFVVGTIGTELAPLVVFEALPALFPAEFRPVEELLMAFGKPGAGAGDWVDQYGFVRKSLAPPPTDATDLPVGFVLSHHRPGNGAASPVPFVALSCAACHTAEIRTDPARPGAVVYGAGNPAMNLLPFSEAVRGMIVRRERPDDPDSDYALTLAAVERAHAAAGRTLTAAERAVTWAWLRAARAETTEYQRVVDEPPLPPQLFDPRFNIAGPARTQPFRSLVRVHLDRPGWSAAGHQMDQGCSKVPVVFHQHADYHGDWAQFDGSVRDPVARSTLAASTAGANVHNLARPDIAANVRAAAEYTLRLPAPAWRAVFPDRPVDAALASTGREVYRRECRRCHGEPDDRGGWRHGPEDDLFGTVLPLTDVGTDPERVRYRHKHVIPKRVADKFGAEFRKDHPLATFTEHDLRGPDGYYCGPIGGAFLRAPYLHNASVLTLAELVGLEPRRAAFYRGRNAYDPDRVGYHSPPVPMGVDRANPVPHDPHYYHLFDTAERGNSNRGHEYPPWGFRRDDRPPTADERARLLALVEYLKTV